MPTTFCRRWCPAFQAADRESVGQRLATTQQPESSDRDGQLRELRKDKQQLAGKIRCSSLTTARREIAGLTKRRENKTGTGFCSKLEYYPGQGVQYSGQLVATFLFSNPARQ